MQIVRESIFSSAIRSFFNTLLAMLGILVAFFTVLAIFFALSRTYSIPNENLEIDLLPDADGHMEILTDSAPVLLRIDISGVIGEEDDCSEEAVQSYLYASQKGVFKNRVKGVMLYISSPGGSATEGDLIYTVIKKFKEKTNVPVYAFTPDICASGGYYIACAADKIFANPIAIVGSCGVKFGPNFNFYEFLQSHGIKAKTFADGKNKDKLPLFEPWNEEQNPPPYQDILDTLTVVYDRFLNIVHEARASKGLTRERLRDLGASVYAGKKAETLGFVDDANSSYDDALRELAVAANVPQYQVVRFIKTPSAISCLISNQLKIWLHKSKELLLGISLGGTFENQPLYYYDASRIR